MFSNNCNVNQFKNKVEERESLKRKAFRISEEELNNQEIQQSQQNNYQTVACCSPTLAFNNLKTFLLQNISTDLENSITELREKLNERNNQYRAFIEEQRQVLNELNKQIIETNSNMNEWMNRVDILEKHMTKK